MTAPARTGRRRGLGLVLGLLVVAGVLLAGSLTADRRTDRPYDTTSTAPNGTRALVQLIEDLGGTVEVADRFPIDADVAVAFEDVVPSERNDAVSRWVEAGHTLVIADPRADLAPGAQPSSGAASAALGGGGTIDRGRCTVNALAEAGKIDVGDAYVPGTYVDDGSVDVCFTAGRQAFVAVAAQGSGHVVGLATGAILQNRYLGRADNAVVGVDLIAPRRGTRVAVLTAGAFPAAAGRRGEVGSMSELLTTPGVLLLAELGVAAVIFAVAASRRLGRPLVESQPVQIAGSELVGAVGDLLRQQRDPHRAAAILRADLRRTLAERTGLPPDAPPAAVADAVAARTGRPVEEVRALLTDHPVPGNADLVRLTEQIDTVREEVLHGRTP